MATVTTHLSPKAATQLELSNKERIRIIRAGSFITLKRTEEVLDALEDMLHAPRVTRPKNLLLIGDPNNGKSTILEHFLETSNGPADPSTEKAAIKVVMINAPPAGDRKDFYVRILEALFAVYNPTASHTVLRPQAVRLFRDHGIEVLIVDELHDALSGTERQQNLFNAELKQFSNETKARIAAAGLEKAGTLFIRDTQMTSRFKRMFLEPFKADKNLGTLLATMEKRLPLRHPSNLKDPRVVAEVANRSEGAIGDVCDLIEHCAIAVIKSGATPECITLKTIQNIDWQRPTARKAFTRLGRDNAAKEQRDADKAFALNHERSDDDSEGGF
ncbi:MAG: TniB family NTP-binding protein, partial [Variovorax sp.]